MEPSAQIPVPRPEQPPTSQEGHQRREIGPEMMISRGEKGKEMGMGRIGMRMGKRWLRDERRQERDLRGGRWMSGGGAEVRGLRKKIGERE
jgi:hypothetical protein